MTYFHLAPNHLAAGSVIEPGNWGRIVRDHTVAADEAVLGRLYRELAFEHARKHMMPAAPSRLNCIFLFQTEQCARSFQDNQRNWRGVLHEVEPVDIEAPSHLTSWALFDSVGPNSPATLLSLDAKIRSYWTETPSSGIEVLWGGSVRILRTILPPQSLAYRGLEPA